MECLNKSINTMQNTTLTEDQKRLRLGYFTGSEIHKLMGKRGLGRTGETYILEKLTEKLTGQPIKDEFSSIPTSWGIEHEPEAKKYFEAATGNKVIDGTTLVDNENNIAGTPDGFMPGMTVGFEIKCPYNSANHLKYLLLKSQEDLMELKSEYFWQIYCYMWLTGLDSWKFCSYDPRFEGAKRMKILNIDLNEAYLKQLKDRVNEANNILKTYQNDEILRSN